MVTGSTLQGSSGIIGRTMRMMRRYEESVETVGERWRVSNDTCREVWASRLLK
jgi:hypothetical protein